MRTYREALTLADAGATEIAGYAGGKARRVCFERRPSGGVAARVFQTDVVTFYGDRFEVRMGGYVTPSTFDGIAAALSVSRAVCGKVKGKPYLMGTELNPDGFVTFGYDGRPLTD